MNLFRRIIRKLKKNLMIVADGKVIKRVSNHKAKKNRKAKQKKKLIKMKREK